MQHHLYLLLGLLVPALTHAQDPALVTGQDLKICPNDAIAEITDLSQSDVAWSFAEVGYALRCENDPNIYLLSNPKRSFDSTAKKSVHVNYIVDSHSPEALFVDSKDAFNKPTRLPFPLHSGGFSVHDPVGVLYVDSTPSSCAPGTRELKLTTLQINRGAKFTPPVSLGVCTSFFGQPTAPTPVTVLDYARETDGSMRVVIAGHPSRGSLDVDIEVVAIDSQRQKAQSLLTLSDAQFFPRQCGQYFKTARLLPHANHQLALFYATPKVVLLDFSDANALTSREIFNGDNPDAFRTCEGGIPRYETERDKIIIWPRSEKRTFFWYTMDLKLREPIVAKISY